MANAPKWPVFQIANADGTVNSVGKSPKWPVIQIADANGNLTSLSGAGTYNVQDYGAKGDNTTDDTAAINAAIAAAYAGGIADGTYYGEVYFPPATYLVSGALTQGGATKGNAQITLPVHPTTSQKFMLVLRGGLDNSGLWHWQQNVNNTAGGAVLKSTINGTNNGTYGEASVIGGPTHAQGYGGGFALFSNVLVVIQGLRVIVPNNPSICGVDLMGMAEAHVLTLGVFANSYPAAVTPPTSDWQFGLRMPDNDNNAYCRVGTYNAQGQNFGLVLCEHTVADVVSCVYCIAAVEISRGGDTPHHSMIRYLLSESCTVGVGAVNAGFPAKLDVDCLDWEGGSGGFAPWAVVNDTPNYILGTIKVTTVDVAAQLVYDSGNFQVKGAGAARVYDLTRAIGAAGAGTPAVPTSTTVLRNPMFRDCMVVISGGTVTAVKINGVTQGITSGAVWLGTGQTISITYSAAPTWVWTLL